MYRNDLTGSTVSPIGHLPPGERLMLAEFPDDYPRYHRQVPRLVPGLHMAGWHRAA